MTIHMCIYRLSERSEPNLHSSAPSQTLAHLAIEYLTSYRRVLLKAYATVLATDKNTSLLGMLDQIEMEMETYLW